MAAKKPTMAQAYKAAQKSTAAKPKDKGIVGEGKDVLKAAGNSVKQQAEFVGAVGKGAAKGAGAVAKGAGKVAGKVANITIGDIASAPLDFNPMYFDADAMFNQKGMKRLPSQGRVDDKTVHIRKGKMTSRDGKYDVKVSTVETPYSVLSNTRAGKQSIYESSATKRKTPTKKKGK